MNEAQTTKRSNLFQFDFKYIIGPNAISFKNASIAKIEVKI